jgi:DNA-binding MarR family transcriptional regulator
VVTDSRTSSRNTVAVANRLRPALLRLNRELRRELRDLGVTGGQATLLALIAHTPGIGVRELATHENISSPGMTGHVQRLEQAGLVRRVPSQDDRRRVGLYLTRKGERVLRAVRSRRTAWLAKRLRTLDPRDVEAIDAAIEPLLRLVEEPA